MHRVIAISVIVAVAGCVLAIGAYIPINSTSEMWKRLSTSRPHIIPPLNDDLNRNYSLVYLVIEMAVWCGFAILALRKEYDQQINPQLQMTLCFIAFVGTTFIKYRDVSDIRQIVNVPFHACGYFKKVVLTVTCIHTRVSTQFVGKIIILLVAMGFVYCYSQYINNVDGLSAFVLLDAYTDTTANCLLLGLIAVNHMKILKAGLNMKDWFCMACLAQLVGFSYAIVMYLLRIRPADYEKLITNIFVLLYPIIFTACVEIILFRCSNAPPPNNAHGNDATV